MRVEMITDLVEESGGNETPRRRGHLGTAKRESAE